MERSAKYVLERIAFFMCRDRGVYDHLPAGPAEDSARFDQLVNGLEVCGEPAKGMAILEQLTSYAKPPPAKRSRRS